MEVFDWNQLEQAKSLGEGRIDLAEVEPFEALERDIQLSSAKHGKKGQVHIRMMFQPEIIAKSRQKTSTFSSAGRAMTQIGGLPVSAGKGVIHGITGLFGGKDDDETRHTHHAPPMPSAPAGQASHPIGQPDSEGSKAFPSVKSMSSPEGTSQEPGTLRVTVLDAKDLSSSDSKPYVTIRVGDREVKTKHVAKTATPEWYVKMDAPLPVGTEGFCRNESFTFAAGPFTAKLFLWIHGHKTLGKDHLLGDGEIDVSSFGTG